MGMVEHRVAHEHLDFFTHQLLVKVPDNGVVIHIHTRILGVVDQRVADCLHINTVRANLIIRVYLTIDRVGIDVERVNLERVSMNV